MLMVAAMWDELDHGAISHGCQGVEGIGAMGGSGGGRERAERAGMHWGPLTSSDRVHGAMKGCIGGGGEESGEGGAGGHALGMGPWEGCMGGGCGWSHVGSSGKGAWERGRVRAEQAGMHRGPLKDRSMGPRTWEGCMGGGG